MFSPALNTAALEIPRFMLAPKSSVPGISSADRIPLVSESVRLLPLRNVILFPFASVSVLTLLREGVTVT
jgi:hypothetical protein